MKVKVNTLKSVTYKGHSVRNVEDEFGNQFTLIDNPNEYIENAPSQMDVIDFPYASMADAKRAISGRPMLFVDVDLWDCRRTDFINRKF